MLYNEICQMYQGMKYKISLIEGISFGRKVWDYVQYDVEQLDLLRPPNCVVKCGIQSVSTIWSTKNHEKLYFTFEET